MKTIHTTPEFFPLTEEEVSAALDAYEALFQDEVESDPDFFESLENMDLESDSPDDELYDEQDDFDEPKDPVVAEVARLISEYARRFDEYCLEYEELPEDVLNHEPEYPIEQIAFEIFTDALHDALQDADEN